VFGFAKFGNLGVWSDHVHRLALDILERDDLNETENEHKVQLIAMAESALWVFSRAIGLKKELA
jgi:hypothetical protein